MWKQQHREPREHLDEGREYGHHDRGSYHDQDPRRDERHMRERSRERYRENYDTYNTNYGESHVYDEPGTDVAYSESAGRRDRVYWDTDPEDPRYRDDHGRAGQNDRHRDNRDRVPEDDRFRDDRGRIPEDDRFRDERGRAEEEDRYRDNQGWDHEEVYDHREVRDVRDTDIRADRFESDRSVYKNDQEEYGSDRRDFASERRDWGDDRLQHTEDWNDYRNKEDLYRDDRDEFRNDRRDNYKDRGNYRDEDTMRYRTDRDTNTSDVDRDKFDHKKDSRRFADSDRGGFRNDPSRDRNGRNISANRTTAVKARPGRNLPQSKIGSQLVNRVENKGKVAGQRSFGQRFGRQEQSRQNETADTRKGFTNYRKGSTISAMNRSHDNTVFSSGKSSRDLVDRKKPEIATKGHAGYSSKTHGGTKTEIVVTL